MAPGDEEFLRELQAAFQIEADEHLQVLEAGVLELESLNDEEQRQSVVETVYREAHSLKGAARAVNRAEIETVCQSLEGLLAVWKRRQVQADAGVFDALHQSLSLLRALLSPSGTGQSAPHRREIVEVTRRLDLIRTGSIAASDLSPPTASLEIVPESASPPASRSAAAEKQAGQETVRISTAKLEALLRQTEEMLIVKQAAGLLSAELRDTQEAIERWARSWSRFGPVMDQNRLHPNQEEGATGATIDSRVPVFFDEGRATLKAIRTRMTELARGAEQDHREVSAKVDGLLEDAKKLLMLPFSTLLVSFPKMMRDLARDEGKDIQFLMHGAEVEMDKRILEEIKDPLIHLLRNSVGHGVELPEERERQGKPRRATIAVAVAQGHGSEVQITVTDDGAGIDAARVKESALRRGLITEEQAGQMDEDAAADLIFQSDVSTSPIVTELSGRGLGMAIVREKVEKLAGRIELHTTLHEGTLFEITLPTTLATFKGILVRAAGQLFVIPTSEVERVLRVPQNESQTVENRPAVPLGERWVPIIRLDETLGLGRVEAQMGGAEPMPLVVIGPPEKRIALWVEEIVDEQEVLVKGLSKPLIRVRHLSGVTILGSGKPVPILSVADLVLTAQRPAPPTARAERRSVTEKEAAKSILVAEDSITSRMLLKNILETAGYRVTTAVDGMDAFTTLGSGQFALVVSDVDMPRMDGFALTARIRADPHLEATPVVLVTARDTREDRERGVDAGASAYLVKSGFDQSNLLAVVRGLL